MMVFFYRDLTPSPPGDDVTVHILPTKLHEGALKCNHDAPAAEHQGAEKTLLYLRKEAYWVAIARDLEQYWECQSFKNLNSVCHNVLLCKHANWPTMANGDSGHFRSPHVHQQQ